MSKLRRALAAGTLEPANLGFIEAWRPAEPLWRVYAASFGATGFNGTDRGHARFSPLRAANGRVVPTLYAGTTLGVALMETVLRDVPSPSVGFQLWLPEPAADMRRTTELVLARPLRMIDFSAIGLRRIALDRPEVIDCDSANYVDTQALAAWAHAHTRTARKAEAVHGIVWTSRQDDSGQAALFFGDRIPAGTLAALNPDQHLSSGRTESALVELAQRLGIAVVFN